MMKAPLEPAVSEHDYLLRLAASGLGRAYKSLAAAELGIRPGDVVVDLGCGPGADLPAFAAAAGASGRVIGIDRDPSLVRAAADRTAAFPQVEVRTGDVHACGLPGSSADRVHTDRVLQHVADPGAALAEARRVLRPGGHAVFAEPDWDTLIVDYPDLPVARAYTRFVAERVIRNAAVGRQLPRLAEAAGFMARTVTPVTAVIRDVTRADRFLGFQRVTDRAVEDGYLTVESGRQWLSYLTSQPFFASVTLYILTAGAG